jgi:hypothetical protein
MFWQLSGPGPGVRKLGHRVNCERGLRQRICEAIKAASLARHALALGDELGSPATLARLAAGTAHEFPGVADGVLGPRPPGST